MEHLVRALEGERDHLRIGPGRHHEVVLELARVAVVDDIDAGPDVAGADPGVRRDVPPPPRRVLADEVADAPRRLIGSFDPRGLHPYRSRAQPLGLMRMCHSARRDTLAILGGGRDSLAKKG